MQQDNSTGSCVLTDSVGDYLHAWVCPVAGNDAPVYYLHTCIIDSLDSAPVLEAVRRTHILRCSTGDALQRFLAVGDVGGSFAAAELKQILVIACMQSNQVSLCLDELYCFRMLGSVFANHKEGGMHIFGSQKLEQLLGIGRIRAVIKGEGNELAPVGIFRMCYNLAVKAVARKYGEQEQRACKRKAESSAYSGSLSADFFVYPQPQQQYAGKGTDNKNINNTHSYSKY